MAKRTRPECLVAVSFLSTRVTKSDVDDMGKLCRVIQYIRGSKEKGIRLRPGKKGIVANTLIDAAYGVKADLKSVSGSTVVIGDVGPADAGSTGQKIMVKSSFEAELVAASDKVGNAIKLNRFLKLQGHDTGPITLYQDNKSCIMTLLKGKGGSGSRHIDIRYYWLHDRIQSGEIKVVYLRTEEMYANVLTKPLQGAQFQSERMMLTGWRD